MRRTLFILALASAFSTCTSHNKRILILFKGNADIDGDKKTVVLKGGSGLGEKEVFYSTGDIINLTVTQEDNATATVAVKEDGLHFLNTTKDTILGSYQLYSDPGKASKNSISQETLRKSIDSLELLIQNKNVSPTNRNFFLAPGQVAKLSDNVEAFVVTPYHQMTSMEGKDGKAPEVYRFWSIKEIRETIDKLKGFTQAEAPKE